MVVMFELGKKQSLMIVKELDFGVYLGEELNASMDDRVLLPKKQVPQGSKIGDEIEVFLYKDSKDRIIATTNSPLLCVAKVGRLKVYHYLQLGGSGYGKDDIVQGTVYEVIESMGAFVAVDDRFSALIPNRELYGSIKVGDVVTARVTSVKEDGKLDLSVREKAYLQIEKDVEKLEKIIAEYGGVLPFSDKASPEVIKRETGMSKNEFKRAVGNLLKNGKIIIKPDCIRMK